MFLPHPRVKVSIAGSLRDREVACSASDRQGSNFESCVWRTVSSQSSHHPQEVLLAQFSLYVHKSGLKPDSFHFLSVTNKKFTNEQIVRFVTNIPSITWITKSLLSRHIIPDANFCWHFVITTTKFNQHDPFNIFLKTETPILIFWSFQIYEKPQSSRVFLTKINQLLS